MKAPLSRVSAAAVVGVAALVGALGVSHAQTIVPAPAFNAGRLGSLPRDEWLTNGGTIANQRYS
jgi:hypothetical protein